MIADFARRWREIEPLLDRLFEVPAPERKEWLRVQCTDASLRQLVTQALDAASSTEAIERGVAHWLPAIAEDAPPVIAGYRVLRFVGAGGMASVFEAERALPGGPQTVALKLLRANGHALDERRRFLREQGILACLRHPHIAQLLDAGFTPAGTPFLALEFVAGDDIVRHCDRRALGRRERLMLFLDVCAAVEHAHRCLIVHRDLKPSNVLVDADGRVKLVDFGIAKRLIGDAAPTRAEARRLTRAYAAPEQWTDGAATTAIDVYALGVLLAELLCGARPRRAEDAVGVDPRGIEADALRRALGADLDAVVREATAADPQRRYASVAALREDIERHLDGRPLRVRAHRFAYRAATLARRHALAVAAAAVLVATLAAATIVGLHESSLARGAAREARAQALFAHGESKRADAVESFLEGLFDTASPATESGGSAAELLAHGRERADRDFATQPALRIEILALVGDLERRSGHPDRARQPLEEAATLAKAQFSAADRRTLHVEYLLAKEADELGRVRDAAARLQSAIEAFEAGPDRDAPEEVPALAWLAGLDERMGKSAEAIDIGTRALALARRVLPADSDALTEATMDLGWILMDAGRADRAEPLLREALARKRSRFGARHPEVADAMTLLTSALVRLGRYGEGEQLMRDAVDIDASAYPHAHPHQAWHLNDLANVLALEGRLDEAATAYARAIAIDDALAPAAAIDEAVSIGNLARIRFRQGDLVAAEAGLRDAIERKQRLFGTDYGDNGRSYDRASLAEVLVARGRLDEARTIVDGALAEAQQRHRHAHPDVAFAQRVEAELASASGDRERAAMFAGQAVATYAALRDPASDKAIRARLLYGEILEALDRNAEAKAPLESALAAAKAAMPSPDALVAHAAADLARVAESLGDRSGASRLRGEAAMAVERAAPQVDMERDLALHLIADTGTSP